MKPKRLQGFIVAGVLMVTLGTGVFIGKSVQAGTTPIPGSSEDPLVTQSYVKVIETKLTSLQQQVTNLQTQVTTLQTKLTQSTTTPTPTPTTQVKVTVLGTSVNFRQSPSTSAVILATYPQGTTLPYIGKYNGWVQVRLPSGKAAWALGTLVRVG